MSRCRGLFKSSPSLSCALLATLVAVASAATVETIKIQLCTIDPTPPSPPTPGAPASSTAPALVYNIDWEYGRYSWGYAYAPVNNSVLFRGQGTYYIDSDFDNPPAHLLEFSDPNENPLNTYTVNIGSGTPALSDSQVVLQIVREGAVFNNKGTPQDSDNNPLPELETYFWCPSDTNNPWKQWTDFAPTRCDQAVKHQGPLQLKHGDIYALTYIIPKAYTDDNEGSAISLELLIGEASAAESKNFSGTIPN